MNPKMKIIVSDLRAVKPEVYFAAALYLKSQFRKFGRIIKSVKGREKVQQFNLQAVLETFGHCKVRILLARTRSAGMGWGPWFEGYLWAEISGLEHGKDIDSAIEFNREKLMMKSGIRFYDICHICHKHDEPSVVIRKGVDGRKCVCVESSEISFCMLNDGSALDPYPFYENVFLIEECKKEEE